MIIFIVLISTETETFNILVKSNPLLLQKKACRTPDTDHIDYITLDGVRKRKFIAN